MIRKLVNLLEKVISPSKIEEKVVEKPKPKLSVVETLISFSSVPAPVLTPLDPWFSEPVKTEKQITHEEMLEEAERREEENRKEETKEPENIHQVMYEKAMESWGSWQEKLGGSENFQEGPDWWQSGAGYQSGTGYNQFRP